jgi:hypothetical protein
MLTRWEAGAGDAVPDCESRTFDQLLAERVRVFQRWWASERGEPLLGATGSIGPVTHHALLDWADEPARELLRREFALRHPCRSAREVVVEAALLALDSRGQIVYSGRNRETVGRRWQGIEDEVAPPEVPRYADCSSFATWCLWLAREFGAEDPSSREWAPGSTHTMEGHGRAVSIANARPGSLFFYFNEAWGGHVGVMVERVADIPMIVGFGREGGPAYVRYDYRVKTLGWNDLRSVKDYIRD